MTSSSVKSDDSTDEVLPLSVMLWNEITKLRQEIVQLNNVIKELKEPKSIIESLVQHILEETDTPETDTPKHQCEFLTDPERGKCSFCEAWGTALPMVYPDVFQDTDE
jgi:hypothetical protein